MFCPVCGNEEVDIFCLEHLKEKKPLLKTYKPFSAEVCIATNSVKHHGTWRDSDNPETLLREFFPQHLVFEPYAEIKKIEVGTMPVSMKSGLKQEDEVEVRVTGRASTKADFYTEEYSFPYSILNTLSPRSKKLGTTYFEGTLQVRNEDDESKRVLLDLLHELNVGIAKEDKHKNGTDYYLTSNNGIRRAATTLQHRFGGRLKESSKLFSHDKQRSRDMYRTTSFIELPNFKEGDVVKGTDPLLVLERGKRIRFRNLRTGKKQFLEYQDWPKLQRVETTVAETRPELTVIHPETFQSAKARDVSGDERTPGERVDVVIDEGALYIVGVPR